jgi:SOS response regulatory protein OraA/RecX
MAGGAISPRVRTPKKARASRPSRSNAFDGGASDGGARPARALTAFDLACRWLARAARSESEIRLRLAGLGFSDRAVDDAVTRLRAQRFVDDGRLASGRARTLAARGYGDGWIRADLRQRGLPDADVELALAALPAESVRAGEWLDARGGRRDRPAAWRALLQRGFSADTAESIVGDADSEGWPE